MLMGGWLVNLVSKHRRSSPHCSSGQRRQMLSSNLFHLFPPILFISLPGEKNSSTCCQCLIFSYSLICLWRAFCVGKVRICIDTRKLCRQQHRKRYTLKHLSHNTTQEINVRKRINNVEVWCWNIIRGGWYG